MIGRCATLLLVGLLALGQFAASALPHVCQCSHTVVMQVEETFCCQSDELVALAEQVCCGSEDRVTQHMVSACGCVGVVSSAPLPVSVHDEWQSSLVTPGHVIDVVPSLPHQAPDILSVDQLARSIGPPPADMSVATRARWLQPKPLGQLRI